MSWSRQNIAFAGLASAIAAAAFISLNNILTPQVYTHGGSPLTLVVFRYLALILATGIWVAKFERAETCSRSEYRLCLLVGAVYACVAASLLTAISFLPVSLAILIFYLFPLLTLLFESMLDGKMPRLVILAAMITALIGLAIAMGLGSLAINPVGIVFAVLAAVCASLGFVISGRNLRGVKPILLISHSSKAGLVIALILLAFEGRGLQTGNTPVFWIVLVSGVASFGAAYYLMFAGIRLIGAVRTSMTLNLEPVFTIILSAIVLLETLTMPQMLGAVVVILSVAAAQYWTRSDAKH